VTRYARRFRKVSRSLSHVELMRSSMDETFALTDQDLLDKDAGRRFLDFYGDEGLRLALERYAFFAKLSERGWTDVHLETSAHDERHMLLIEGLHAHGGERERLLELVVRRDRLAIDPPAPERTWEVLTVDWLTLRNPSAKFTKERLRLPGQDVPGLGVGELVLELLYRVVDRLALDGLLTVAEYFHNAVLYARELPFVDPWHQGQLHALEALLFDRERLSFAQAAWAMHWGHVVDVDDDSVVRWKGEAMVHTDEAELSAYLRSDAYLSVVTRTSAGLRYRLDRSAFDEEWAKNEEALLEPAPADTAASS
jgi:hypothetical protein